MTDDTAADLPTANALPAATDLPVTLADQPHAIVERDGVRYTLLGTAHVSKASIEAVNAAIDKAATLVWNGPLGAFEIAPFDKATVAAAQHAAANTKAGKLLTVAGGGDTVSALNHAGVADDFTYISTAGGAFLEWMEGKELPGVKALEG